jgi:hypothetical protein
MYVHKAHNTDIIHHHCDKRKDILGGVPEKTNQPGEERKKLKYY